MGDFFLFFIFLNFGCFLIIFYVLHNSHCHYSTPFKHRRCLYFLAFYEEKGGVYPSGCSSPFRARGIACNLPSCENRSTFVWKLSVVFASCPILFFWSPSSVVLDKKWPSRTRGKVRDSRWGISSLKRSFKIVVVTGDDLQFACVCSFARKGIRHFAFDPILFEWEKEIFLRWSYKTYFCLPSFFGGRYSVGKLIRRFKCKKRQIV